MKRGVVRVAVVVGVAVLPLVVWTAFILAGSHRDASAVQEAENEPLIMTQKGVHCAGYRHDVKYMTDPVSKMMRPRMTNAYSSSVQHLNQLLAPADITKTSPRQAGPETTIWKVTVRVLYFAYESDNDYHLGIASPTGNKMVAEVVAPACTPRSSPFYDDISRARAEFVRIFGKKHSGTPHTKVTIQGPGFFDFLHGGGDQGSNAFEIHPVLSIVRGGAGQQ